MKCPKCGYVGFEAAEKCRNCGYHFSLAEAVGQVEVPMARGETRPPVDAFTSGVTPPPLKRPGQTPGPGNHEFDLTLTPPAPSSADGDLPLFDSEVAAAAAAGRAPGTAPAPARRPAPGPPRYSGHRAASPGEQRHEDSRGGQAARATGGDVSALRARLAAVKPAMLDLEPEPSADEFLALPRARAASASRSAGPLPRALAALVDALVLAGLDLGVVYFTLRVCRLPFADITLLPLPPLIGFFLLLDGAYLVAFTANGGQTVGKMAAGIRVVAEDGRAADARQAAIRAAGYLASVLPAGLGFVPGLFGPARRALHDRLANTRVIKT